MIIKSIRKMCSNKILLGTAGKKKVGRLSGGIRVSGIRYSHLQVRFSEFWMVTNRPQYPDHGPCPALPALTCSLSHHPSVITSKRLTPLIQALRLIDYIVETNNKYYRCVFWRSKDAFRDAIFKRCLYHVYCSITFSQLRTWLCLLLLICPVRKIVVVKTDLLQF
jgi:hypothetical protein